MIRSKRLVDLNSAWCSYRQRVLAPKQRSADVQQMFLKEPAVAFDEVHKQIECFRGERDGLTSRSSRRSVGSSRKHPNS